MSHEPSIKRLLRSDRAHWRELEGALYVTNGFAIVRVDETPLAAWIKASHTESLADFQSMIDRISTDEAKPTPVAIDMAGLPGRVFRTPSGPLAVNEQLLAAYNGKATFDALSALRWRTGNAGVSGWSGEVCMIAAMALVWGRNNGGVREELLLAASPLEVVTA